MRSVRSDWRKEKFRLLQSRALRAQASGNAVLSTCPSGPLVVLGHCAGSLIAYELAQNLRDAGRAPVGLILIDPPSHQSQVHLLSSGLNQILSKPRFEKTLHVLRLTCDHIRRCLDSSGARWSRPC